jgi:hypothetical protein
MKTIEQVMEEFLGEQQARLKPRTYSGYEYAIRVSGGAASSPETKNV